MARFLRHWKRCQNLPVKALVGMASSSWVPISSEGSRQLMGSWKIIAISRPMMRRRSLGAMVSRSMSLKRIRSARTVQLSFWMPTITLATRLLPEPDSPPARGSPLVQGQADSVHRLDLALGVSISMVRLRMSSRGISNVSPFRAQPGRSGRPGAGIDNKAGNISRSLL